MSTVTSLSNDVSDILMQLQALNADIAERVAESDTADAANLQSAQNRDNAVTAVEQVRQALETLEPIDQSRLEELRQLISEARTTHEDANLSGVYQALKERIGRQRETREGLEAELEGLGSDIRHLRQVSSVLPTGCSGVSGSGDDSLV